MDERQVSGTEREASLPEHERDDDVARESGSGVLSEGLTALNRGTGTVSGTAQPLDDEEDDEERAGDPVRDPFGLAAESVTTPTEAMRPDVERDRD